MTTYLVHAMVNVSDDNFFGYKPEHPMALVTDTAGKSLLFVIEADDTLAAADAAWVIGNREGADVHGQRWPSDIRSMSVGDMVTIRESSGNLTIMAIANIGFDELIEPINSIVPIEGTRHTSRGRQ